MMAGPFSLWPEPLGLAAIASDDRVREFADIIRREYLAAGIRVTLHPQLDVATEPRWPRTNTTFGEDADLAARLGVAYVRGLQGEHLGTESVAAMIKHFPGGGPQKDGNDPHFAWGREQVYPGDNAEYHPRPFRAALEAGAAEVMPYYGIPLGTGWDEVGFAFNKPVITGVLRQRLGFDGIVCTDWGLVTDHPELGDLGVARAWGVEHLGPEDRVVMALDAGVITVGRKEFRDAGYRAQRDSLTLLSNTGLLPLPRDIAVFAPQIAALDGYARKVEGVGDADVAVLRIKAPYLPRFDGMAALFHHGSLEFGAGEIDRVVGVCAAVPTVVDVYLDRPAVLTPFVGPAGALVANYGVTEPALLDVLFGVSGPRGRLPFDLPRSDAAVAASRTDMAFDTADPMFRFGHGLRYGAP